MIGNPKYNVGDEVSFSCNEENLTGIIFIVDAYGTFENNSDVSYDIMIKDPKYKSELNPEGHCLCKHIPEKYVK